MVKLIDPQPMERCNDPAAGTFGFMIAAAQHVEKIKDTFEMTQQEAEFFINEQFSGCELVLDTHRLALMNAMLHGLKSNILLGDSFPTWEKK